MLRGWFVFLGILWAYALAAQSEIYPLFFRQKLTEYNLRLEKAQTDAEKVATLDELAEYFYLYKLEKEGDSILKKQLTLAELSMDKNLVLAALFSHAIMNINPWTESAVFDQTLHFINSGLQYARKLERRDYVSLAYIRMANVLRNRGQLDEALIQAGKAFSALEGISSDSIRAVLNLELGDIYLEKKEAVQAFQNFSNAYEIAYASKNVPLQSQAFHRFFSLYQYTLKNPDLAQENLFKSLALNKAHNNLEGLLADYKNLARSTDNPLFIDSLLTVAQKLKKDRFILSESSRLNGKNIMLAYHTVITANSAVAIHYLKENSDLDFYIHNLGTSLYYLTLGNIYFYSKQFDSSLLYYKLGEPELVQSFESGTHARIYRNIGFSYQNLNRPQEAIRYLQKSLLYNNKDVDVLLTLSKLYAAVSDYKNAYTYNSRYDLQMDTIRQLNNQREIDLLEVEQANRQRQKELDAIAAEQLRRNNLQYTGISFGIAFLFIAMLIFGMFPISKLAIRTVNFFAFICLFEFIILLIDNWLHHQTHGEPLKIWLAKIFIIAILLPLHHYMEHLGVKFMDSRKLIRLRERIKFRSFWRPSKKTIAKTENNLEETTLI